MSNPVGVLVLAIILGFVIGIYIRKEYFNTKTYLTILALAAFIDIFLGNFPFYTWDLSVELPVSMVFISTIIGLLIGKFIGGR